MIPFFAIFSGVLAFDILTKVLVRAKLPLGSEIIVAPFFSLVHIKNTGIAFGLFQERNIFFIGLGVVLTILMMVLALKLRTKDKFAALVLAGILGGAVGNLIDRVIFGEVTDFLDFYWRVHHWPAFNIADAAICVGAGLLVWQSFRQGKNVSNPS